MDATLNFCLEDGSRLIDHPGPTESTTLQLPTSVRNEPATVKFQRSEHPATRSFGRKTIILSAGAAFALIVGGLLYLNFWRSGDKFAPTMPSAGPVARVYWEMREDEQMAFISDHARRVQQLIGDQPTDLDPNAVRAIKIEIDDYVKDRDSLSQKPLAEGLRVIFGRATQFAPAVGRSFEAQHVPAAIGIYQAMIESEYHDCLGHEHPNGPVGLFQFSRKTAAKYGLEAADYCDVKKQSDAAARYMSDLLSDFGSEGSSWTLALQSFNLGAEQVREYLRKVRARGLMGRTFWVILNEREHLGPTSDANFSYVPRFFAAAIIGENPQVFGLATPPLTTLSEGPM